MNSGFLGEGGMSEKILNERAMNESYGVELKNPSHFDNILARGSDPVWGKICSFRTLDIVFGWTFTALNTV